MTPGHFTTLQLQEQQDTQKEAQQQSQDEQQPEQLRNDCANDSDLNVSINNMSMNGSAPNSPPRPRSISSPLFTSPVRSVPKSSAVLSGGNYASLADHASDFSALRQDGTNTHPYVKFVSFHFPERNLGFDVEYVLGVEHDDQMHDSVIIRRTVPVVDHDKWEAKIPAGPAEHDNKRLVLIRGPSQDFWMGSPERFHRNRECAPTRKVHQATQVAIENDDNRKHSYWLLVFPDDVAFDNKIFSGEREEGTHVTLDKAPQRVLANANPTEKDLLGMVLVWRIAQKSSSRRLKPKSSPVKDDIKGMFAT